MGTVLCRPWGSPGTGSRGAASHRRTVRARGGAPVPQAYGRVVMDAAAAVPIRARSEDPEVTVAVVWELE